MALAYNTQNTILHENVGVLKWPKMSASQNGPKCRRLKMLALKNYSKFKSKCAYINYSKSYITCAYRNVGIQALTIRARRALHSALLLSQAEVLVLILVLSFWRCCSSTFWSSSGISSQIRSAYMAACPPYWHGWWYWHAMTKTCQNVGTLQNVGGRRHFDHFSEEKSKS